MALRSRMHVNHRGGRKGHFNRKVTLSIAKNGRAKPKPHEVDGAKVTLPISSPKAESASPSPAPTARERGSYDGDTAIKLYLREIGQVKLLTPDEEIELAARIQKEH